MSVESRALERQDRGWTFGSVFWLAAMSAMAGVQTWRGAYEDGILFFAIVLVLAVDRSTGERLGSKLRRPPLKRWMIWAITSALGVVLVVAPRHGTTVFVTMMVLGVVMVAMAWAPVERRSENGENASALRRSAWLWASIAVAVCLWEAITFVLSMIASGGSEAHPTVSVLLDPMLETILGRIVFVGLWLAAGAGLVFIWRRK